MSGRDGYDDDGAAVEVWYYIQDADYSWEHRERRLIVDIEPNHADLIRAAAGDEGCGLDPDDHDWTSQGEGGCRENPGVWSTGGTSLVFRAHCRRCGLIRVEKRPGSQRNPGEHDTTRYEMADTDQIERWRKWGAMDEA